MLESKGISRQQTDQQYLPRKAAPAAYHGTSHAHFGHPPARSNRLAVMNEAMPTQISVVLRNNVFSENRGIA